MTQMHLRVKQCFDYYWFYMEDFIMYDKYLEQLEKAGKIRNLKERSFNCYKPPLHFLLLYRLRRKKISPANSYLMEMFFQEILPV